MDTRYYLAVDIGASSGRHMLSHMENGKMVLEEIYRFPNGMTEKAGHKVWVVDRLFEEILTGMKKCLEMGKIPYSMGIDTWAVDFVLLDETTKCLEMRLPTGMTEQRTSTKLCISLYRRQSFTQEPVFRSRALIPFIS